MIKHKDMTTKVTMMRRIGDNEWTLRRTDMSEVIECVKNGKYAEPVSNLRRYFPLMSHLIGDDGTVNNVDANKIGRVCFTAEWDRRGGVVRMMGYNGLVLLEVNNLRDVEEAEAVRSGAGRMPQTLLAFVGASGHSVKIVCRGELFPDSRQTDGNLTATGSLPTDEEAVGRFHLNLYEQARLAYNAQLGVTIEKLEPRLDRACYLSSDSQMVYNPYALPFYVDQDERRPATPMPSQPQQIYDNDLLVPGRDERETWRLVYEHNLTRACEETYDEMESDERPHHTLTLLAQGGDRK